MRRRVVRRVALVCALISAVAVGTILWVVMATSGHHAVTVGRAPYALAVSAGTGRVFVLSDEGETVSVVDGVSRALVRTLTLTGGAPTGGFRPSPHAIAVDNQAGHAFVVTGRRHRVSMLDARSGTLLRTVAVTGEPSAVAVDERAGRVFVVGAHTTILDARTGAVVRVVPGSASLVAVDARRGRVFIADEGAASVRLLDATTGALLRTLPAGGLFPGALAVDPRSGRVVVTSLRRPTVSLLDPQSGALAHTVVVGPLPLAVAVDEQTNHVFVASLGSRRGQGSVSMLDTTSGRLLRTVPVAVSPHDVTVDTREGWVFVPSTQSNTVSVLDGATGRIMRTVAVAGGPVAVDAQAGQAFVLSTHLDNGSSWNESPRILDPLRRFVSGLIAASTGHDHGSVTILDTHTFR